MDGGTWELKGTIKHRFPDPKCCPSPPLNFSILNHIFYYYDDLIYTINVMFKIFNKS